MSLLSEKSLSPTLWVVPQVTFSSNGASFPLSMQLFEAVAISHWYYSEQQSTNLVVFEGSKGYYQVEDGVSCGTISPLLRT